MPDDQWSPRASDFFLVHCFIAIKNIGKGGQGVSKVNIERKSEKEPPRIEGIFRKEYSHITLSSDLLWVLWWELVGG